MPNYPVPAFISENINELGSFREYQLIWSVLHYPAGVVPVTFVTAEESANSHNYQDGINDLVTKAIRKDLASATGMPVGVQVVSQKWDDEICLGVMTAIDSELRKRSE